MRNKFKLNLVLTLLINLAVVVQPLAFESSVRAQRPGGSHPVRKGERPRSRGRALLVGIDQYKNPAVPPTYGGKDDAESMHRLALSRGWFRSDEIRTLIGPEATAANIKKEFVSWLINESAPGDQILFFYSGHGTQVVDEIDGDERDGDQRDEAIAPYDAFGKDGRLFNVITDDEFNQWIGKLSGRSVVLIFDSCHSGTVTRSVRSPGAGSGKLGPRYFPDAGQWVDAGQWAGSARTRSMSDQLGYEVTDGQQTGSGTRNLKLVVDETRLTPNSLVTLISASDSHQLAYPMITPIGVRGALSYYLEEGLKRSLNVGELRQYVKGEVSRAQQENRLKGQQVPHFEMNAESLIANRPLFRSSDSVASTESVAILGEGMSNPESEIRVTAEVGLIQGNQFLPGRDRFCLGHKVGYRITSNTPGYIFMVVFSQQDQAQFIYPDKKHNSRIDGRLEIFDEFHVTPPAGKDVVLVFLTKQKLDLSDLYAKRYTWDEARAKLKEKQISLSLRTRGIGGRTDPNQLADADWQVTRVESEARERCQ